MLSKLCHCKVGDQFVEIWFFFDLKDMFSINHHCDSVFFFYLHPSRTVESRIHQVGISLCVDLFYCFCFHPKGHPELPTRRWASSQGPGASGAQRGSVLRHRPAAGQPGGHSATHRGESPTSFPRSAALLQRYLESPSQAEIEIMSIVVHQKGWLIPLISEKVWMVVNDIRQTIFWSRYFFNSRKWQFVIKV